MSNRTFLYIVQEQAHVPPDLRAGEFDWPLVSAYSTLEKAQAAVQRSHDAKLNPKIEWTHLPSGEQQDVDYWFAKTKKFNGDIDEVQIVQYPLDVHPEDNFSLDFVAFFEKRLFKMAEH